MAHAADLVEEVLRIYGMDRIEIPGRFVTTISPASNDAYKTRDMIADWLASNGFHEMQSLSMVPASYYDEAGQTRLARLINPLSSELEVMRTSMLHHGLEHIARNHNHRSLDLRLFEFGSVYAVEGDGFRESEKLAVFLTGAIAPETWERPQKPVNLYSAKTITSRLLDRLGLSYEEESVAGVHVVNGVQFTLNNTPLGHCGEVNSQLLKAFDIKQPVYYGELDWDACAVAAGQVTRKVRALPRFPAIRRDLAVVVDEATTYATVFDTVTAKRVDQLEAVDLFDIYRDDKIGAGKKSFAIAFTFRDEARTLTDADADAAMANIIQTLQDKLNATIRTS
jgi:phenylalanyl-tRNA synthetase beta chain